MQLVYGESFEIVGIAVCTNNAAEASGTGRIPELWTRVTHGNDLESIANRADTNIVALYTEYQDRTDGEYTFVIGGKVSPSGPIPEGMVHYTIPAGDYLVFTSERGPGFQVVPALWQRIWKEPSLQPAGPFRRTFQADFEVYDQRSVRPEDLQVDIYIGVAATQPAVTNA